MGAIFIVFQCPASFLPHRENIENLQKFFNRVRREGIGLAWEPRGDWPGDIIKNLCEKLQLIHCVDPFKGKLQYEKIQYFRLHGIRGYGDRYTDEDLKALRRWAEEKPTYMLFKNKWMKEDGLGFQELIGAKGYDSIPKSI